MSISQQQIADHLGLDRTTVTKILNRDPRHKANAQTADLVFKTARQMGYDFSRLRHIHRREFERRSVDLAADVAVLTDDAVFDRGTARIKNISPRGVLLMGLELPRGGLPLAPFHLHLKVREGAIEGVEAKGAVAWLRSYPEIELGLTFVDLAPADAERLKSFIA